MFQNGRTNNKTEHMGKASTTTELLLALMNEYLQTEAKCLKVCSLCFKSPTLHLYLRAATVKKPSPS